MYILDHYTSRKTLIDLIKKQQREINHYYTSRKTLIDLIEKQQREINHLQQKIVDLQITILNYNKI